jgi:hypothetical protein
MKYPQALTAKLEDIKAIVDQWSVDISFDEVVRWMMQFDNNDFELAYRIIKNLNVIGYEELKSGLNIAYSKLERKSIEKNAKINTKNTLFAGIGEGGKSGAMVSYNFRIANELSEENFLDDNSLKHLENGVIENIVLVDDIISTGRQATDEIQRLREWLTPLGVKNIFLLSAVGMKEGIKKVEDDTGAYVFSAFEYDINDTVNSFDSEFYSGLEFGQRNLLKERLEYYGRICNPKSPLGYGNVGGLIVFYYNTPNSTIPHVWTTLNSWLPLFKRTLRINGIDSYYKQFENLRSQKPKTKKGKSEFTLFVEGRSDEEFLELFYEKLKDISESEKINVIALGGFYSTKLIENLNRNETKYLFVIEDDPYEPSSFKDRKEALFKGKPYAKMKPIIDYVNVESLLKDEEFTKLISPKWIVDKDITSKEFRRELETLLFRRASPAIKDSILKTIIPKHLKDKMLEDLFEQIKMGIRK